MFGARPARKEVATTFFRKITETLTERSSFFQDRFKVEAHIISVINETHCSDAKEVLKEERQHTQRQRCEC